MRRARRAVLLLSAATAAWPALAQDQAPFRAARGSIAAPALQDEIRPRVIAAARARLADPACDRSAVADSAFNGWSGEPLAAAAGPGQLAQETAALRRSSQETAALRRPWEETWIVDLCGRIVDVLLLFTPGAQGLTVAIPAESVHIRP